jgi:PII-like signaling protein
MLELSVSLPVKIEVVDSEEMINMVLPEVSEIVQKGLVEISDTYVVECCGKDSAE